MRRLSKVVLRRCRWAPAGEPGWEGQGEKPWRRSGPELRGSARVKRVARAASRWERGWSRFPPPLPLLLLLLLLFLSPGKALPKGTGRVSGAPRRQRESRESPCAPAQVSLELKTTFAAEIYLDFGSSEKSSFVIYLFSKDVTPV